MTPKHNLLEVILVPPVRFSVASCAQLLAGLLHSESIPRALTCLRSTSSLQRTCQARRSARSDPPPRACEGARRVGSFSKIVFQTDLEPLLYYSPTALRIPPVLIEYYFSSRSESDDQPDHVFDVLRWECRIRCSILPHSSSESIDPDAVSACSG